MQDQFVNELEALRQDFDNFKNSAEKYIKTLKKDVIPFKADK